MYSFPSSVQTSGERSVKLEVPGFGAVTVDTAYGGDSFVVVDATALGVEFKPEKARKLAEHGVKITNAFNASHSFPHPTNPELMRWMPPP
jgi:proline racemase